MFRVFLQVPEGIVFCSLGITLYLAFFCVLSFVSFVLRHLCSGTCRRSRCFLFTIIDVIFLLIFKFASHRTIAFIVSTANKPLGRVARSKVSANPWLSCIRTYRLSWCLTSVSANHASNNSALVGTFITIGDVTRNIAIGSAGLQKVNEPRGELENRLFPSFPSARFAHSLDLFSRDCLQSSDAHNGQLIL